MTASQLLFFWCLAFVGGIAIASFWDVHDTYILAIFIAGIFFVSVFWKRPRAAAAGALILGAAFGVLTHESAEARYAQNALRSFYGEELSFGAKVAREPQGKANSVQITIRPDFVANGSILVSLGPHEEMRYGDTIRVQGRIEEPRNFDDFDYAALLAKDGIYAVMFQPKTKLLSRDAYAGPREKALSLVFVAKSRFQEVLRASLAPPGSEIAEAILLGNKGVLSLETKATLNAAGVRHITAISGMHVAILTAMLMSFLLWIGLWRQQAFYITLLLIFLFVVLTGVQPSAIRAGIMGAMFLLGQHLGRQNVSTRALVFAATGMLVANPFLLTRDVGFQLSFLAVLGIILFLPIFQHLTRRLPEKFHSPRDIMGMTVAAQIFTLPVLVFNFGFVSLVTIATNLLVVPLLSWFMGFGYLFLVVGSLIQPFAFILSLPISLLLLHMNLVIDIFSSLPFAAVQTENLSLPWVLFLYIPVVHFYWKFRRRHETFIQW